MLHSYYKSHEDRQNSRDMGRFNSDVDILTRCWLGWGIENLKAWSVAQCILAILGAYFQKYKAIDFFVNSSNAK